MSQKIPAVFARGGTSKALIFHLRDLPADRTAWDGLFMRAMGSPDSYGRQLDGMGGGLSSVSKVCVVGPSTRADADVDYTFVQVQVKEALVDYGGNCGNMSSAIGPFAVDEGLLSAPDGECVVRIHNTNTGKVIHSTFAVRDGRGVSQGELAIPGVSGTGAPVRLDFLDPGGASTGRLLPGDGARQTLHVPGVGAVEVSLVDAANACVFVDAAALGLLGTELPDALEADPELLARVDAIRVAGSIAMGLARTEEEARRRKLVPFIGMVASPRDSITLAGDTVSATEVDLVVRMFSNGQPHRALPLTAALCTAVAAQIEGTLPSLAVRRPISGALRLAMPSGVITVDAAVPAAQGRWHAAHGSFYRTTRRLFEGFVHT